MKFPKLFGKKEEDDDLDEDEFEIDDLDDHEEGAEATAIDDEDLSGNYGSGPVDPDDEMIGSDDDLKNPFDDVEDDLEDDYDEEDEATSRKKALIFASIGGAVVLVSVLGGVGWWFVSAPETTTATAENDPNRVELAMPAPPGSLNSRLSPTTGTNPEALDSAPTETSGDQAPPTEPVLQPAPEEPAQADTLVDVGAPAQPDAAASLNSLNNLNATQSVGGGVVVPAISESALARLPDHPTAADQSQALSPAPVNALIEEKSKIGKLPKIASNGAQPWQVYARPVDPGITTPRIALMIDGVGLSRQASLGVINKLPPEISLILSPYGRNLNDWVFRARLAGHELFMALPMESEDFPIEDAGPLALDTRVQLAENQRRLDTVMASAQGYVGLVTMMGSRFMKADGQVRQVLQDIKSRGLMLVIGGSRSRNEVTPIATELNLPRAESEMVIDIEPRIQQIRENLDRLESMAKDRGGVIAMARPYPVTIKSILDWIATLEGKDVILVPASSIATFTAAEGG